MATRLAATEVLELATEDDCFGRSNSENRDGSDGAIHAYHRRSKFGMEGSLGFLRMNSRNSRKKITSYNSIKEIYPVKMAVEFIGDYWY